MYRNTCFLLPCSNTITALISIEVASYKIHGISFGGNRWETVMLPSFSLPSPSFCLRNFFLTFALVELHLRLGQGIENALGHESLLGVQVSRFVGMHDS